MLRMSRPSVGPPSIPPAHKAESLVKASGGWRRTETRGTCPVCTKAAVRIYCSGQTDRHSVLQVQMMGLEKERTNHSFILSTRTTWQILPPVVLGRRTVRTHDGLQFGLPGNLGAQ